jgi:hypothetical protein
VPLPVRSGWFPALAVKDAAALCAMFDDSTIMSDIRAGMLLRHEHAADVHDQAAVRR